MTYITKKYDEAFINKNSVRTNYKKLINWFKNQDNNELRKKNSDAMKFFQNTGVSFKVYSNDDKENLIPFDIIPRIINYKEWDKIVRGITQRVLAINFFLNDIYGEQEIIKHEVIPVDLIQNNSAFLKQMIGFIPPKKTYNHISGIDLIKTNSDNFYVLEDNVRVPSGASYMIENRDTMIKLFPDLISRYKVFENRNYANNLSEILKKSSPKKANRNPNIVLLTPGIYNSAFFEHAFLADKLGIELVEGKDLRVINRYLNMKTIEGWKRVDVIYRRIDDIFLDPLSFKEDSFLGVPGLMEVYRNKNVTIANAPGTGISDDKSIYSYIPDIIKFYLGQKPILKNVKTFKCRVKNELKYVLDNLNKLVVKEVHGSGGYGMLVGPLASKTEISKFKNKIKKNPYSYIAQPTLSLSTCPIYTKKGLTPRHVDLRCFALLAQEKVTVTSGGLTRVALKKGSLVVNSSQGGGTKDTWILSS